MVDILFTLLLLTVVYSAAVPAAFLFRRFAAKGRGKLMYFVWLAVIVAALLPLKLGTPRFYLFGGEAPAQTGTSVSAPSDFEPDYSSLEALDSLYGETEDGGSDPIPGNVLSAKRFSLAEFASENAVLLLGALLAVWLAGAAVTFIRTLFEYKKIGRMMRESSVICYDRRAGAIFDSLTVTLGFRRRAGRTPELRVVRGDRPVTPCVCGFTRPVVYIGADCLALYDNRLALILTHELCHVKRHDLVYKLFALAAFSVHWFNPLTRFVNRAVYEDCELACDTDVLSIFGRGESETYMRTIIDIAASFSRRGGKTVVRELGGGLFISQDGSKRFLKRRYVNMKKYKTNKTLAAAAALFMTAVLAVNLLVLSACGVSPASNAASGALSASPVIEEALRAYYGLAKSDKLTSDHYKGVETLEISVSRHDYMLHSPVSTRTLQSEEQMGGAGKTLLDFKVNGEDIPAVETVIKKWRFEDFNARYYEKLTGETVPPFDFGENTYESFQDSIRDSYGMLRDRAERLTAPEGRLMKLNAFYCLKDPNDPLLTEQGVQELIATCPICETGAYYFFDPYASERELQVILAYWLESGYTSAGRLIEGTTFDASALKKLTNLKSVKYVGVQPTDEQLPSGATSNFEEYVTTASEKPAEGISTDFKGYSEPQVRKIGLSDDGRITLYCRPLEAALSEYFVLTDSYYDSRLTQAHLDKVKTIEMKYVSANTEKYFAGCEALAGGSYLEFTINGTTLGLIPSYYPRQTFEAMTTQGVIDEKANASIIKTLTSCYELVTEGALTCYKLKSDVTEAQKSELFSFFAKQSDIRAALTGKKTDDTYTISWETNLPWYSGFRARFTDTTDLNFTPDKQFLPNLTEAVLNPKG